MQLVESMSVEQSGTNVYWSEGSPHVYVGHKFGTNETGTSIWDGDAGVVRITNDGQRVYFTADDGLLHAVYPDGGGAVAIGTPNSAGSFGITYDQNIVYWTIQDTSAGVVTATSTTTLHNTPLAASQKTPLWIASDGTNLYWIDVNSVSGTGQVMGCLIESCAVAPMVSGTYTPPMSIVVDSNAVYWSEVTTGGGTSGTIWKLAK